MKWIDDDAVASARFEPETKIAGKIRERMMNCGAERRGPPSLRLFRKTGNAGRGMPDFFTNRNTPRGRAARADAIDSVSHVVS